MNDVGCLNTVVVSPISHQAYIYIGTNSTVDYFSPARISSIASVFIILLTAFEKLQWLTELGKFRDLPFLFGPLFSKLASWRMELLRHGLI